MDADFPPGMVAEIESFLSREASREPGHDIYDDVFLTAHMFPLQRQQELIQMIRLARSVEPRVVMEIGADKSGGFYHWIKCLPTVKGLIACEIRGTPYSKQFEKAFPDHDFLWLPGSSTDPAHVQWVNEFLDDNEFGRASSIDVLFIDGDKGGTMADFNAYRHFMNEAGVVFIHDVSEPGHPRDTFVELGKTYRTQLIHDISDTSKALARQAKGLPPSCAHEGWLRHWKGRSCGVGVVFMTKAKVA